jgi:hypothetical protein
MKHAPNMCPSWDSNLGSRGCQSSTLPLDHAAPSLTLSSTDVSEISKTIFKGKVNHFRNYAFLISVSSPTKV